MHLLNNWYIAFVHEKNVASGSNSFYDCEKSVLQYDTASNVTNKKNPSYKAFFIKKKLAYTKGILSVYYIDHISQIQKHSNIYIIQQDEWIFPRKSTLKNTLIDTVEKNTKTVKRRWQLFQKLSASAFS